MIVIVGKTGSGKSTVVDAMKKYGFHKIITDTTRPKRDGEFDGIDYRFLTNEAFSANKRNGIYAETVTYNASFGLVSYGSRKSSYKRNFNKNEGIIILNPYGLKEVIKNIGKANIISFYLKLEDDILRKRLAIRGDSQEEVDRRLKTDFIDFQDIEDVCDYTIHINDNTSVDNIVKLILSKLYK